MHSWPWITAPAEPRAKFISGLTVLTPRDYPTRSFPGDPSARLRLTDLLPLAAVVRLEPLALVELNGLRPASQTVINDVVDRLAAVRGLKARPVATLARVRAV